MTELELSSIIIDLDLQPREAMNQDTITQYAEDMVAGIEFEPVRVFKVTDRQELYHLTRGFHRVHAAAEAELGSIICEVIEGTYQEAMWDAAGSNTEFDTVGMRRSNEDKQRAVRMALTARPKLSDTQIAKQVHVAPMTVGRARATIYNNVIDGPREVTRNGKTYEMDVRNIGRTEAPSRDRIPVEFLTPTTIATEVKPNPKPTFNQTNEMVDWAKWTWNPVTGCEHNCIYCYARDIANRFYPQKFAPTFLEDRLEAPRNTRLPGVALTEDAFYRTAWKNVFVCSMADLFGRWVPDDWIDRVFGSCRRSPEWNYLFLTKFPQRYTGLKFPETSWVGTSVDEQKRVPNAEKAFRKIDVPVKWLSVEPMTEAITFTDLKMFDWVVIGGQSRSTQAPEMFPDPEWVVRLIDRAIDAGCKVYCKPNTDPNGHWAGIFKQYPRQFEDVPKEQHT